MPTEERVAEMIKEGVKTIQQEEIYHYSVEEIKFLNILESECFVMLLNNIILMDLNS